MKQQEIIEQIRELTKQLNGDTQIFIVAFDKENMDVFGYGCKACALETVLDYFRQKSVVHTEEIRIKADKTRVN